MKNAQNIWLLVISVVMLVLTSHVALGESPEAGAYKKCEGTQPYIYIEDRKMDSGKTVEIPVIICNAVNLANMDITFNYDSSALKAKDAIKGSLNAKSMFDWNPVSAGKLKLSFASKDGMSGSGSIAVLIFDVIGKTGAKSSITGTVTTASKTDGGKISLTVNPGKFSVEASTIKGDCDGDNELTERDALAALQMSVEKRAVSMCFDYNGDGSVDSSDARDIMKAIVGSQNDRPAKGVKQENITKTTLFSQKLSPSSTPQTVSYQDKVTVTVPAGLLKSEEVLTISDVQNPPERSIDGTERLAVYDISIGDLHNFDKNINIEMTYDPAKLRSKYPPEKQILASRWDPDKKVWLTLPSRVDTARNKVIISTNHLSVTAIELLLWDIYTTENFEILYDGKTINSDTEINDKKWAEKGGGGEPGFTYSSDVPNYIEDMGYSLEKALDMYMVAGFEPPLVGASAAITGSTAPVVVKVDSVVAQIFDPLYEKIYERIHIPTSKVWRPGALRGTTAHELFHAVQHQYYTMWGLGNLWWIESTAEYAAQNIAWNPGKTEQTGISAKYLEEPLTSSKDKHDYSTVHFINYLVQKKGINFKEMWDYVTKAEWWNFGDTKYPLSEYLKTKGFSGLNDVYADFAEYFIFDSDSPMPANPKDEIPEDALAKWTMVSMDSKSVSYTFDLKGGHTAKLWGIRVELPEDVKKRKLSVKAVGELTGYTRVNVYLLNDNKRPGTKIGGLIKSGQAVNVDMSENDGLYILAVNTGSSSQQIKVTVGDAEAESTPAPTTTINKPSSRPIVESITGPTKIIDGGGKYGKYEFSVKVSGGTPPYYYKWYSGYDYPLHDGYVTASTYDVTWTQLRWGYDNGAYIVSVQVKDSNKETIKDKNGKDIVIDKPKEALWLLPGTDESKELFVYKVLLNGVVTEPSSFPYKSPE